MTIFTGIKRMPWRARLSLWLWLKGWGRLSQWVLPWGRS